MPRCPMSVLQMNERLGESYGVLAEVKNVEAVLPDDVGEAELVSSLKTGVQLPPLCHGGIKLR